LFSSVGTALGPGSVCCDAVMLTVIQGTCNSVIQKYSLSLTRYQGEPNPCSGLSVVMRMVRDRCCFCVFTLCCKM
jgi:hypothetical protein